ncbi:MAG: tetratricopeptide repeat protein, partial [Rubrivivax sp.]
MGNPSPATAPAPQNDDRVQLFKAIELQNQGLNDQAEALFNQYLAQHPNDPAAIYSLSVIYFKRGDHALALQLLDNGVKVAPHFAPVWFAHGSALQSAGRFEDALLSYDKALEIKPDYLEVLLNSGVLLRDRLRHAEALDRFQRVLAINPNYESALGNSGIILTEFKRSAEAIAIFDRLLKINPHYDYGWGLLSYERLHICDWTDFEVVQQHIIEGVRAGQRTCKSLPLMAISDSASDQQLCARAFATQRFPASNRPLWQGERYKHKKIRLAYVSPDLREHPVGHLMAGIFERHDKSKFETIAISLGPDDNSRLRSRMLASFDQFIDVRNMGSRQIAEMMRSMEIDIAVDLAGYTADSRTEVFAHRPAPIQVNYLGYPGT